MKELIEALQIIAKYCNAEHPTHCEHDVLYFPSVDYDKISDEDKKRLGELSFFKNADFDGIMSYRFGSC